MAARNMWRIEIKVYVKELCFKLVIYKDYTEMNGQQNLEIYLELVSSFPATDVFRLNYIHKRLTLKVVGR
jgi:hypothetical protein